MKQPRRLNSAPALHPARDGAPKDIKAAPIKPGMSRQTKGDLHPFVHGQSVEGGAGLPAKSHETPIRVHDGMTLNQMAKVDPVANDPKAILADASRLGRPPEKA